MNDLIEGGGYTSPAKLEKFGVRAAACIAGGVVLLAAAMLGARFPVVGLAIGAVSVFVGAGAFLSKDKDDKLPGAVILGAGALMILSRVGIPLVRPLSQTVLSIGTLGLIASGIYNGIKFIIGLKKRS